MIVIEGKVCVRVFDFDLQCLFLLLSARELVYLAQEKRDSRRD